MSGPSYETPAEVSRACRAPAPPSWACRWCPRPCRRGRSACGCSGLCSLTNALGEEVAHEEVVRVSNETAIAVGRLLVDLLPRDCDDEEEGPACRTTCSDLGLAAAGPRSHRVGGRRDAGAGPDQGAVREGAAAGRHPHRGVPARDDGDGQPDAHAGRRRRRGGAVRLEPAVDPGRRGGGPGATPASTPTPSRARTRTRSSGTSTRCWTCTRRSRWTTARDMVSVAAQGAPRPDHRDHRRHRGDDHGRHPPARDGGGRRAEVPDRDASTTPTRSTCSTTASAPASRRSTRSCAPRTACWPGRTIVVCGYGMCGRGVASRARGHGRARDRDRGRPHRRDRGGDGGLPRHADPRGRPRRRHLHHASPATPA